MRLNYSFTLIMLSIIALLIVFNAPAWTWILLLVLLLLDIIVAWIVAVNNAMNREDYALADGYMERPMHEILREDTQYWKDFSAAYDWFGGPDNMRFFVSPRISSGVCDSPM